MTKDEIVFAGLVLAFATFATAHVSLCFALASRSPRVRGLVAFVIFPLAPAWGAREGFHKRVVLWAACAVLYVALRVIAAR